MTGAPTWLRVELLGPVQLRARDDVVTPGGPKLRAVVAVLALAQGRVVGVEQLLDAVWAEDLPATARNSLQYHVTVLRKALAAAGAGDCLATREPGYALAVHTDAERFLERVAAGGRAASAGESEEAAAAFAEALNLWRGPALADLRTFEFAEARAVALENQRLTCLEAWGDAELACGRAETLLSPLQEVVAENPTRERLWEQLMIALYRTGRQDAALAAYRSAHAALDRELGVAPSARLVSVHEAVLRHDARLAPVPPLRSRPVTALNRTTLVVPSSGCPTLVGPRGRRVRLGRAPVVMGRHGECDLVLSDELASRRHARVEWRAEGYVVLDLGSTNGTYLNGQRIAAPSHLEDGDRIEVGHSVVRFLSSDRLVPSGQPDEDLRRLE